MTDVKDLMEAIRLNKFNHHNQQIIAINYFESLVSGDIRLDNATNPIVALLEHNTACCASNNIEVDSLLRDLDMEHAKTIDDLVRHVDLSSKNNIHAVPGEINMILSIRIADLEQHSVLMPDKTRKVIIPQETVIGYKDSVFYGIHHAIEIVLNSADNIDVKFLENDSPLCNLENPVMDTTYRSKNDLNNPLREDMVEITIKAFQFVRETHLYSINKTAGFSETYDISDQYYHARVYNRVGNTWVELRTEISEAAYNPADKIGVALVQIRDRSITIKIPQIYITNAIIKNQVKVVLYTTKGAIDQDYLISIPDDFSLEFRNDDPTISQYTGPLAAFGTIFIHSKDKTRNGKNMPTLEEIRDVILSYTMDGDVPITRDNLKSVLLKKDYELVHEHNYIDKNLYVASKRLEPLQLGPTQIQVACGGIEALLGDMTDVDGVHPHGANYTITPKSISLYENGALKFLKASDVSRMRSSTIEDQILLLNDKSYLATPFYYLVTRTLTNHECCVFDLDCPEIVSRNFISNNSNSAGLINTRTYSINKDGDSYIINLTAMVNDTFKEYDNESFIPQLKTTSTYGTSFAINGEYVSRNDEGDYIYKFTLPTDYELGKDGTIVLKGLAGPSGDYDMPLETTFNLTYNLVRHLPIQLDEELKEFTMPNLFETPYQTVTHESLKIKIGSILHEIYNPTRTLLGTVGYRKYDNDILAYYTEDVYKLDSDGYIEFIDNPDYDANDPDSLPYIYTIEHLAGDPILNDDGSHVIKHRVGDHILDSDGELIPEARNGNTIMTRLILLDYKYLVTSVDYLALIRGRIIDHINADIKPLQDKMIDLSELRYNLSNCLGNVKVRHDRNRSFSIAAALTFKFIVNVDHVTYSDGQMRKVIADSIRGVTSEYLKGRRYARNELMSLINKEIGGSVTNFDIAEVGGYNDIIGFTLEDDADIVGIKGQVYLDTDGNLQLRDGIDIIFEII